MPLRLSISFAFLTIAACSDPIAIDAGFDAGASDGGADGGGGACVEDDDPCAPGDVCCAGDRVCQGGAGRSFCVFADDTCFVGAEAGCCLDDADCLGDATCHFADCRPMGDGVCKEPPPAGGCWSDRDCPGGSCSGASVCQCGVSCLVEDSPGTCG